MASLCRSPLFRLPPAVFRSVRQHAHHSTEDSQTTAGGLIVAGTSLSWLLSSGQALAVDRQYGILEGTTLALVHPAVMLLLFGTTIYAGWLGWQWRRLREIGAEIRELKKQLPKPDAEGNVPPSSIDSEIAALEEVHIDTSNSLDAVYIDKEGIGCRWIP